MKARWIVLSVAGAVVVVAWGAAAAISLEAFFWVGAGVLGWSFLAGRRATLERLRRRFFGG